MVKNLTTASLFKESTRLTDMANYKFDNIGIGDLTYIACDVLKSDDNVINFCANTELIKIYRPDDVKEYSEFMVEYLSRLLPQKKVSLVEDQSFPIYMIHPDRYGQFILDGQIHNHFKSVFSNPSKRIEEPYIVINTKARSYSRGRFEAIKRRLFEGLNSFNTKVVLLGEKEVEYNLDYVAHGHNLIYSIYNDVVNNVDPSLLVDMTFPKMGMTTPDIDRLFTDVSLAYSANSVINVGGGGFFCLCSLARNMKAIVNSDEYETFPRLRALLNNTTFDNVKTLLQSVSDSLSVESQMYARD